MSVIYHKLLDKYYKSNLCMTISKIMMKMNDLFDEDLESY